MYYYYLSKSNVPISSEIKKDDLVEISEQEFCYISVNLKDFIEGRFNRTDALRAIRSQACFPVINRGQLWYNKLTDEQKEELDKWYNDWLNVTETLIEPKTPEWLK